MEKFVVSRDDSIYESFPDIALTGSGKIICVFFEFNHHNDRSYSKKPLSELMQYNEKTGYLAHTQDILDGFSLMMGKYTLFTILLMMLQKVKSEAIL